MVTGGLVVCANCSQHQDFLRSSEVVNEPGGSHLSEPFAMIAQLEGGAYYRCCDVCHIMLSTVQSNTGPSGIPGVDAAFFRSQTVETPPDNDGTDAEVANPMQRSISDASELDQCPVCGTGLEGLGDAAIQERHLQDCLDSGSGVKVPDSRYLGESTRSCVAVILIH